MPKRKSTTSKETNTKVGNISSISGIVNVAGHNITMHQTTTGLSATEINQLFEKIHKAIETRVDIPPIDKADLNSEVQEIHSSIDEAVKKQQPVDKSFLARRFRNIARMAPDILDVVVATLASPMAGIGVAVKKIAEKAKESTK